MRSIRHRKLMEGARRIALGQPLAFQFKISESATCACEIKIWKQNAFRQIEKGPPVSELLLEFKEWVEMPPEMMGKRSNEIALSKSRLYCLKYISPEDLEQFEIIFEDYAKFKMSQESILVPIYGVASVVSSSKSKGKLQDIFLLMPNLGRGEGVIFDLKGYCEGRFVEERDFKDFRFGKDQNFIKSQYLLLMEQLPKQTKENLLKVIQANVMFLRERDVIDYSLVLIFRSRTNHSEVKQSKNVLHLNEKYEMCLQIIDFLQVYNERKKLENKFKSFFFKEISSVEPAAYAARLIQFMRKALLIK